MEIEPHNRRENLVRLRNTTKPIYGSAQSGRLSRVPPTEARHDKMLKRLFKLLDIPLTGVLEDLPMLSISGPQVIGTRQPVGERVGQMPAEGLVEIWRRTSSAIVKYGFVIEYRDLEPPRTGIFDGRRLVIDPDVGFEMQCFILLHLFGHSVQWVAPSIEHELAPLQTETDKEAFLNVLKDYEYKAAAFGRQLLDEVGLTDAATWFNDFVATDWRYVERFYREDRLVPWEECIVHDGPVVRPLPIPPLVHRDVEVRYAF